MKIRSVEDSEYFRYKSWGDSKFPGIDLLCFSNKSIEGRGNSEGKGGEQEIEAAEVF